MSLVGRTLGSTLLLISAACASRGGAPTGPDAPYVVVLGSAQDGGLPQIGCQEAACVAARRDPSRRRYASSILLADPRTGSRWLLDAGPDLREQLELARPHPSTRVDVGPRPPLFDGAFLTHAHIGHYAGLMFLGRESYGASGLPVFVSPRMRAFLAGNAPWSMLVESGTLELRELTPDRPLALAPDLSITALRVPHRDELSDTVAWRVRGPARALLYLPDIDKWERWDLPLEELLTQVDVALLDGTFFADGEVPGRDMRAIPHPFIVETLARLGERAPSLRARVVFTHLNHTNPAADPGSEAARRIHAAGCRVAREGELHEL